MITTCTWYIQRNIHKLYSSFCANYHGQSRFFLQWHIKILVCFIKKQQRNAQILTIAIFSERWRASCQRLARTYGMYRVKYRKPALQAARLAWWKSTLKKKHCMMVARANALKKNSRMVGSVYWMTFPYWKKLFYLIIDSRFWPQWNLTKLLPIVKHCGFM